MTVVIVDESDHDALLRNFEELLGLTTGTLVPQRDASNRSMTLEEIEAVRAFNEQYFAEHFSKALHYKLMARGAALHLKIRKPASAEERLITPTWAIQKANEYGSDVAESIKHLGATVVGDLGALVVPVAPGEPGVSRVSSVKGITPEVAARMAMGVLLASGRARGERGVGKGRFGPTWSEPQELFRISTLELLGAFVRRIWAGGAEKIAGLFERHEPPRR